MSNLDAATPTAQDHSRYFVAVDLGSNSFHMLIVRENQGAIEVVDRVKEMVQIARGLKHGSSLSQEAEARALDCLARFRERIHDIPKHQIRAVGTKALRAASNGRQFLKNAEHALGVPIQLVSGFEEARLVYIGVAQSISHDHRKRLVVDIGGASTEFVIGKDYKPVLLESLTMGCVTFTDAYLSDDQGELTISGRTMSNAYVAACEELEAISRIYRSEGWDITYGASGTMKAVAELMPERTPTGVITREGITELYNEVCKTATARFNDVAKARRSVLAGGIAILKAIFDQLAIEELHVSNAALKEGLIFETVGRLKHHDIRDETIAQTLEKYRIDTAQAERVKNTALVLFEQFKSPEPDSFNAIKILGWSAQLHEIGLALSHSGYHHHGNYILANCDLAGFNQYEQFLLATLVGLHRRKINATTLENLSGSHRETILQMAICLRLSVLINRKRETAENPPSITWDETRIHLTFGSAWLESNPLTHASLQQEANYLNRIGLQLSIS